MPTSRYELDLRPALLQYQLEELSIPQFAVLVAQRLDEMARWAKVTGEESDAQAIEALFSRFDFIAGDSSATIEELDDALAGLYNWADTPAFFDASGHPLRGAILCRVRNNPKT